MDANFASLWNELHDAAAQLSFRHGGLIDLGFRWSPSSGKYSVHTRYVDGSKFDCCRKCASLAVLTLTKELKAYL